MYPTPTPLVVASVVILGGLVFSRPIILGLGCLLMASGHAQLLCASVDEPVPAHVAGVATLMSDPENSFGRSVRCLVELDGRKYELTAGGEAAALLRPMLAGGRALV